LESFDDPNNGFVKFLGALFGDGQTFIVRTAPIMDSEGDMIPTMDKGKILYAFNLFEAFTVEEIESILSHNFKDSRKWFNPTERPDTFLEVSNREACERLGENWQRIIDMLREESGLTPCPRSDKYSLWLKDYNDARIPNYSDLLI